MLADASNITFADLPGTAVAQTTGQSITFDNNAAGHNWFIDQTPGVNEEYLPTSNPNQWIAKEGSEAAGKMDLLSVLLHEYGHALGIDHSADSNDFMAATLQPGVRRLPSSDELALMAQLVGEIKPALSLSNGAAQGNTPDTPVNPSLPVGTTLSALLLGRLRRTGYGSWSPLFDSAQVPAPVPQFAIAANAKLENPAFDGGTGWTTEGAVAFGNGSSSGLGTGAATLTETAASQTRLNQVFVLGEHDRFLSFTLANVALGDQAGPDDAFEVALLDANTGLSLLGGTGLSHNDAFLNIQANSLEHKASGITRIDNPDGSRTYLVDLAGIAAGTTVNLAFDLIGFGQGAEASNSHITVRDLRLGVPQTADDSAMLAEDTPAIIDALTNDLNARQPGFVPVVVSGPAHGQVVVNADASFSFTPEKDWYGQDTFTYKLSDGRVDSNIATVSLTVTPVNDAPTAGDQQLVAIEDTQFTGSLLAAAADIDNVQLTGSIVAGPQHGQVIVAADGSFTYTPDANWNGTDSFTYKVNDGELDSAIATVSLSVTPVNDAPTAGNQNLSTDEDTILSGSLLAAAADIDNVQLTGSIVAGPQHGQVIVAADGSFTYTPDANWNGTDSFTYKVNDGELDSGLATVSLTIAPVNDAPVARDGTATLDEDGTIILDLRTLGYDIEGSALSAQIVTGPAHGSLTQNADGSFTYTPDANWNGTDAIRFKLNDEELDSNEATVTLTVNAVNDAPTAGNQNLSTDEDTLLAGSLLSAAADIDSAQLTGSIVAGPQHGQVIVAADGSFTYTPDANWNGTDSFTYKVNDGELDSAIATVSITVTPVNDAPVASPIAASILEDGSITLNFLGSASDVDGDPLSVVVGSPQHGLLVKNADGSYTYLPQADFNGEDTFSYAVSDGRLESAPALVRLTITAVNDAPVAFSSKASGFEDTPYIFKWSDFSVVDVDSNTLSLNITSLPLNGLLQYFDGSAWLAVSVGQAISRGDIDAGMLCFGPNANESGFDGYSTQGVGNRMNDYAHFTYQAFDGELLSAQATLTMDIVPVADSPLLTLSAPPSTYGATAQLFATSWESVANRNTNSTVLPQAELEGWSADRPAGDCNNHFIVWSSGDKMKDAANTNRTVYAAPGDGNNWIELSDAQGKGHETYGIKRTVATRTGVNYTLSFDYAGRLGYSADFTRLGIYVDGVKIGSYANTSPNTALNWQGVKFQFTGNGSAQTIRIVIEASATQSNGRGAMVDNLKLTELLPLNTGYQDSAIRLAAVIAALTDTDGSETLDVKVDAIPTGAVLSDGTNSFTATNSLHVVSISGWNLANLSLTPPAGFTGSFALTVVASATETASGEAANYSLSLPVTVVPADVTSPIILDLDGDGIHTTALGETRGSFDLLDNGSKIESGWISAGDAFLAMDLNGNGLIDSRGELFGGKIGEGYAKLSAYDSNFDGLVDYRDADFNSLKIWQDSNSNHQTDAGELRSLAAAGIASLSTNYSMQPVDDNGNLLLETGFATLADGRTISMIDAYFRTGKTAGASAGLQAKPSANAATRGAVTSGRGRLPGHESETLGMAPDRSASITSPSATLAGIAAPVLGARRHADATRFSSVSREGAVYLPSSSLQRKVEDELFHQDGGKHHASVRSGNTSYDDGRGARLTVHSTDAARAERSGEWGGYIVVKQANSRPASKVNWDGSASAGFLSQGLKDEDWVAGTFGINRKEKSLGEKTGLVVRVPG